MLVLFSLFLAYEGRSQEDRGYHSFWNFFMIFDLFTYYAETHRPPRISTYEFCFLCCSDCYFSLYLDFLRDLSDSCEV